MADLAAYRQLAPAARWDVTVVFVTEDPRRETSAGLRRWLPGFHPAFVGLVGEGQRTRLTLGQLYAPVSRINPHPSPAIQHPPGRRHSSRSGETHSAAAGGAGHRDEYDDEGALGEDYGVDHSGTIYVFGPDSRTLFYTGGETPTNCAADLTRLVS